MSFIDSTYFIGPLNLAQLGQGAVVDNLNVFINRYESKMMQEALGYQLYLDLIDGLSQSIIDQKWIDLMQGTDFTATGMWPPFYWNYPFLDTYRNWYIPQNPLRKMHWVGFTPQSASSNANQGIQGGLLTLVGGDGVDNPVVGQSVFTLSSLAGSEYYIERRGFGTMVEGVDVSITNNGQTITLLKANDKFGPGEVFILHFTAIPSSGFASQVYASPIAGYVYYWYIRDQYINLSGSGSVKSKTENATSVDPNQKMADAFQQMSKDIFFLWAFLEAKGVDVYPSYDRLKINYNFFKPINRLGW